MTVHVGWSGELRAGPALDSVGRIRAWRLESTWDLLDNSRLGVDEYRVMKGREQGVGSLSLMADAADPGQVYLQRGARVQIELRPSGSVQSGHEIRSGMVLVDRVRDEGSVAGVLRREVSFLFDTPLTVTTAP